MDKFSGISSSQKSVVSRHDDDDVEESGWTSYIEDFYNNYNGEDNYCSSSTVSPSLISDAATGVSRKENQIACSDNFPRKLRPKPKKNICDDDSLEDTASSPVNSPKVSHIQQIEMNSRKNNNSINSTSIVMGKESGKDRNEEDGERSRRNLDGKNELRSRGLCLVPRAMLVDYNTS